MMISVENGEKRSNFGRIKPILGPGGAQGVGQKLILKNYISTIQDRTIL